MTRPYLNTMPVLQIEGLSKSFALQRVLNDLDLSIKPGEIRALAGQNGSGKSTLIKVLAGYHQPDPGAKILVNGTDVSHGASSTKGDLHFIHQDLALVPSLSVVDNLAIGRGFATRRGGRIDWKLERHRAQEALTRFDVDVDVMAPVSRLSPAQQAILAIVRAMQDWTHERSLLVLDEPTAALSTLEAEKLFTAVRNVASAGAGVLFVSHKLNDVLELCDSVSVLRDGKIVLDTPTHRLTKSDLVQAIVGHSVHEHQAPPPSSAPEVLRVEDIRGETVDGISFRIRAGEILGVAGLVGSGREHLAGLVCGSTTADSGRILVDGRILSTGRPKAARDAGIALVPADRRALAVFPDFEVVDHVVIPRLGDLWRRGRIRRIDEYDDAFRWADRVGLRPLDPERKMTLLSGGNQQKVVLAQALRTQPAILVLDEPGQGVDVGAKAAIYQLILDAAEQGAGVLICSSEAEELVQLCNRVLVLNDGQINAELTGEAVTIHSVVHATNTDSVLDGPA